VNTESASSFDKIKLIIALAILAAGIFGFYYFKEDQSNLLRVVGVLVAGGISIAIIMQTAVGRGVWSFAQGSRNEVRKVVWPTRKETINATLIIAVVVSVIGLLLALLDYLLINAVQFITSQGG